MNIKFLVLIKLITLVGVSCCAQPIINLKSMVKVPNQNYYNFIFTIEKTQSNHTYVIQESINNLNFTVVKTSPNLAGNDYPFDYTWRQPSFNQAFFRIKQIN